MNKKYLARGSSIAVLAGAAFERLAKMEADRETIAEAPTPGEAVVKTEEGEKRQEEEEEDIDEDEPDEDEYEDNDYFQVLTSASS